MIGARYVLRQARLLKADDVVSFEDHDYVVTKAKRREQKSWRPQDRSIIVHLRRIDTGTERRMTVLPNFGFARLVMQPVLVGEKWEIALGDVVLYEHGGPTCWAVAIRSTLGWFSSAAHRALLSDRRVEWDVLDHRAWIIRANGLHPRYRRPQQFRVGSVAAVCDMRNPEPSAYLRVEPNRWESTNGIEASDAMIDYEMKRGTYALVHRT